MPPEERRLAGMRRDGRRVYPWTAPFRMRPSFLILGTQRGGTTSLFSYLALHPCVVAPSVKEIRFFDEHWERGARWYRAHFPWLALTLGGGAALTGEATPYYLYHPAAPARAAATLPGVRAIVLLRNPVERALSHYFLERSLGHEDLPLAAALDREAERLALGPEAPSSAARLAHRRHSYVARGRYAEQVERWQGALPRERLLVLQSERFYADPGATLERVQSFLGAPVWHPPAYRRYNEAVRGEVDPALRRRLTEAFRPHNERLFALLGERFDWD